MFENKKTFFRFLLILSLYTHVSKHFSFPMLNLPEWKSDTQDSCSFVIAIYRHIPDEIDGGNVAPSMSISLCTNGNRWNNVHQGYILNEQLSIPFWEFVIFPKYLTPSAHPHYQTRHYGPPSLDDWTDNYAESLKNTDRSNGKFQNQSFLPDVYHCYDVGS